MVVYCIGLVAERCFGFKGVVSTGEVDIERDHANARALGNSLLVRLLVPWSLCLLSYTGMLLKASTTFLGGLWPFLHCRLVCLLVPWSPCLVSFTGLLLRPIALRPITTCLDVLLYYAPCMLVCLLVPCFLSHFTHRQAISCHQRNKAPLEVIKQQKLHCYPEIFWSLLVLLSAAQHAMQN